MKQTRADIRRLHSADHPERFHQHGTVRVMSSSLAVLCEGDGDTGMTDNQSTCSPWRLVEIVDRDCDDATKGARRGPRQAVVDR